MPPLLSLEDMVTDMASRFVSHRDWPASAKQSSEGLVLFRRHHMARPFPRRLVNQALANYSHPSQ